MIYWKRCPCWVWFGLLVMKTKMKRWHNDKTIKWKETWLSKSTRSKEIMDLLVGDNKSNEVYKVCTCSAITPKWWSITSSRKFFTDNEHFQLFQQNQMMNEFTRMSDCLITTSTKSWPYKFCTSTQLQLPMPTGAGAGSCADPAAGHSARHFQCIRIRDFV